MTHAGTYLMTIFLSREESRTMLDSRSTSMLQKVSVETLIPSFWQGLAFLVFGFAVSGCRQETHKVVQLPPLSVTVAKPVVEEVTDYDEYPGLISPYASVDMYARVTGFITKISFTDGQEVKAGDELFGDRSPSLSVRL